MSKVLTTAAMVSMLSGPALAFDFGPDDFAVMYSEAVSQQGKSSRIHMVSCEHTVPDACTYQTDGTSLIRVIGARDFGHTKTVAMLLTTDTSADKDLFRDGPLLLVTLTSPKADIDQAKAVVREIMPSSSIPSRDPTLAMLNGVKYTAGVLPNLILALGAVDPTER